MLTLYSFLYTLAMLLASPLFLLRRRKYASGFRERLGNYPTFDKQERPVIWLHCVSVGETNAARTLVEQLAIGFPTHQLVISTTTRTGQELAKKLFSDKAAALFYFPFDWKFSVRRALNNFRPSVVLLMETEIWPRLICEARRFGAKVAIVNGRLSERSFRRYRRITPFVRAVLGNVDLIFAQSEDDARRFVDLGADTNSVRVTGNLKFDIAVEPGELRLTDEFCRRFCLDGSRPLIVAASTHEPEEEMVLQALNGSLAHNARLLIAPRHPERFDQVASILEKSRLRVTRRSRPESAGDRSAEIILLDSIGELRAVFPLADVVFLGGSLVPHGGQSVLEPAASARAMVTGPFTHNFSEAIRMFISGNAIVQMRYADDRGELVSQLASEFRSLLSDPEKRREFGANALSVLNANRGATKATIEELRDILVPQ